MVVEVKIDILYVFIFGDLIENSWMRRNIIVVLF